MVGILAAFLVAVLPTLPSPPGSDATLPITRCGMTVPTGVRGVLAHDLDCSSFALSAIGLANGASLDLNGHSISNGPNIVVLSGRNSDDSLCEGPCRWTIRGPGEVSGARHEPGPGGTFLNDCIRGLFPGVLTISDVSIHDCDATAIALPAGEVRATRINVEGAPIDAETIRARHSTITGSSLFSRGAMKLRNVLVRDSDTIGIVAQGPLRGLRVTVTQSAEHGIEMFDRAYLSRSIVTENAGHGVAAHARLTLFSSVVVGNGGADVAAEQLPTVRQSQCGRSSDLNDPSSAFGVCANDAQPAPQPTASPVPACVARGSNCLPISDTCCGGGRCTGSLGWWTCWGGTLSPP